MHDVKHDAKQRTAQVAQLVDYFEHLQAADLSRLDQFYSAQAWFKDPFNEVTGLAAVRAVYQHMFNTLDEPRFVITEVLHQGDSAVLVWRFHFRMRRFDRNVQCIRGCSHFRFDAQHRIERHRDYWDPAEELYEKLPMLGALMRWLKRRAGS